jgi:hypothetical protein
MEISGNSLNQPVNFYTKNTGNTINLAINDPNLPMTNVFAPEFETKEKIKNITQTSKRRKSKNKRLNTFDTDYLPDETAEIAETNTCENNSNNIFTSQSENKIKKNLKKTFKHIFASVPLINYCYLRQKERTIKNTVDKLNGINQNVDELLNISVPIGEESTVYKDIADNLNNAVHLIGNANKEI